MFFLLFFFLGDFRYILVEGDIFAKRMPKYIPKYSPEIYPEVNF